MSPAKGTIPKPPTPPAGDGAPAETGPENLAGRKFPCAQCGAKLDFDPTKQDLKCPYCGHEQVIEKSNVAVEEHDYETFLRQQLELNQTTIAGRSSEVRCTGCGAIILLEDKVVTEKCPYCTTHLENKPVEAAAMIPPESLLPFRHDSKKAREAFDRWIASMWFAPNELRQLANLGQPSGVYLPFWTYDSMTFSRYHGQRGDDYTTTDIYTDSQGNTQTRTVTHTRWTSVSGQVQHFFDDVLICAS